MCLEGSDFNQHQRGIKDNFSKHNDVGCVILLSYPLRGEIISLFFLNLSENDERECTSVT